MSWIVNYYFYNRIVGNYCTSPCHLTFGTIRLVPVKYCYCYPPPHYNNVLSNNFHNIFYSVWVIPASTLRGQGPAAGGHSISSAAWRWEYVARGVGQYSSSILHPQGHAGGMARGHIHPIT